MAHGARHQVFSHAVFLHDADLGPHRDADLDLYHHPVGNGILDPVGNDTLDAIARGPIVWTLGDGTVDLPGPPRPASVEVAAHRSLRPAHR